MENSCIFTNPPMRFIDGQGGEIRRMDFINELQRGSNDGFLLYTGPGFVKLATGVLAQTEGAACSAFEDWARTHGRLDEIREADPDDEFFGEYEVAFTFRVPVPVRFGFGTVVSILPFGPSQDRHHTQGEDRQIALIIDEGYPVEGSGDWRWTAWIYDLDTERVSEQDLYQFEIDKWLGVADIDTTVQIVTRLRAVPAGTRLAYPFPF